MTLPDERALAGLGERSRRAALAWRGSEPWRRAADCFAQARTAEEVAAAATALFADRGWLGQMIAPLVEALAADPWFEPPLRVRRDGARIGAVLFEGETAAITASVLRGGAAPAASVVVPGRMAVVHHVAGRARLRLWRVKGDRVVEQPGREVQAGDTLVLDGRTTGHQHEPVGGDLVTVTCTTELEAGPLVREYRRGDGALLRTATRDDRAARAQLLLAFLRADGRREAGDCFAAASRDPAWFLRWDAMREWLALDAAAALPRLAEMARTDPHGDVRAVAAATLARLAVREAA
ncbi:hypothetical protein [Sphingomonas aracearum]|uniref:HEAT repeat domain-containing protein n=1 Tax=Sphingomonas aracearum TaxID=2283317 RepID=A0A369W195_9SPHN|nr:hypothetical protein [Sphingomonas aracearum]RDE07120.1 hypothetical protein DVW87_05555 [Sphingomonas aracearum]